MNKTTLSLINQLIERTKTGELSWKPYSSFEADLKPIYASPLDTNFSSLTSTLLNTNSPVIVSEGSYVCVYNNGYFFLLLYRYLLSGSDIILRIQTKDSKNSKVYASTSPESEDNLQISAQLKRLYNLVENSPTFAEIDEFINDFISTEENHQ